MLQKRKCKIHLNPLISIESTNSHLIYFETISRNKILPPSGLKNEILIEHEFRFQKILVLQNIKQKPFNIVVKLSILDVRMGPDYASVTVFCKIS